MDFERSREYQSEYEASNEYRRCVTLLFTGCTHGCYRDNLGVRQEGGTRQTCTSSCIRAGNREKYSHTCETAGNY